MQYLRKVKKIKFSLRQEVFIVNGAKRQRSVHGERSHQKDGILVSSKRRWFFDWKFVMESEK